MVVASLTMTSEREEVIDFVAPYFEQSGILIGKKFLFKIFKKSFIFYIHVIMLHYTILCYVQTLCTILLRSLLLYLNSHYVFNLRKYILCNNFSFQVMRKPVRKPSLFKFMTVLKVEVWLSIVGALTLTGIMIWILDKYSPYSARNNKRLYPYPCR